MEKISAIVFVSLLSAAIMIFSLGASAEALDTTTPISLATISQHNSSTDCWTAINGKVYDLTSYISQHPGGSALEVICGIDGTQIMNAQHPSSYTALISNFQIGVLVTPDTIAPVITLLGDNPVNLQVGEYYADAGATAYDNVDGDLTLLIMAVNAVDTSVAGTYQVTYTVFDAAGNSAQVVRTAIVGASNNSNEESNQANSTDDESENDSEESESDDEEYPYENNTNGDEHHENITDDKGHENHNETSESEDEEHQANSTHERSESHNESSENEEHGDYEHSESEDSED